MNKDTTNKDSKNRFHGYQEWYHDGIMYRRGNSKNGMSIGYLELNMCLFNNKFISTTNFHIR